MSEELILHHYDASPFSEKIRKIFGWKRLAWHGVAQPMVAPKPKLTPLTGGYRRIPVLQIGADVYCDTALIVRVLEARHPEPALLPPAQQAAAEAMAHWADHWLFRLAVAPALTSLLPMLPKEFLADREAMLPGFSAEALRAGLPDARAQLHAALGWLEASLEEQPFLLGRDFSLADAACFHVLWFLRASAEDFERSVRARPGLAKWFEQVDGLGHGNGSPLEPDRALAIARESAPAAAPQADGSDPLGIEPGTPIRVSADDYGSDPITGTAVVINEQEVALRREDPAVGEVVVHFPRVGFRVARA